MKITLFTHPIEFVKFWWQLKMIGWKVCGDWFGVLIYPTGKVIFRNEALIDILDSCPKHEMGEQ